MCVFLPSVRHDGGKAAKKPNGYAATSPPSVILAPCPGIQSFSGKDQDWIPAFGENDGGGGEGKGAD